MRYAPHYQPPVFRMLALDPGTNKMGVSVYELNMQALSILKIRAWTIQPEQLFNGTGLVEDVGNDRLIRLYKAKDAIYKLLCGEDIHFVAYEAPFMNRLRPNAFGPLMALMTMVQCAVVEYNQTLPFLVLPPQTVKKAIGIAGKKGKEIVCAAIHKHPELLMALKEGHCELDDLDDNAVDSVAVGYAALQTSLFREVSQCRMELFGIPK